MGSDEAIEFHIVEIILMILLELEFIEFNSFDCCYSAFSKKQQQRNASYLFCHVEVARIV